MKNKWQDELRRELKPVRVDGNLKMHILAEAERARFRRRRQRMAMAAVAAVLVAALGLTAALARMRPAAPDRRALSGGSGWVWVSEGDSYYHARRTCGGMSDADQEPLSEAKAEGRTACPVCISAQPTPVPEGEEPPESWLATPEPMPTAVPEEVPANGAYTPMPEGEEPPESWLAMTEPTPMATAVPEEIPVNGAYTPVPEGEEPPESWVATPEPTPMATAVSEEVPANGVYTPVPEGEEPPESWLATPEPTPMPTVAPEEFIGGESNPQMENVSDGEEIPEISVSDGGVIDRSEYGLGVWMTQNGLYYHLTPDCSGMQNADYVDLSVAEKYARPACPVCVPGELTRLCIQAERAGDLLCVRVTAPDLLSALENSAVQPQSEVSLDDCVPLAMDMSTAETMAKGMTDGYVDAVTAVVFTVQSGDGAVLASFIEYDGSNRRQTLLIDGASLNESGEVPLNVTADRYTWQMKGGKLVRGHDSLAMKVVQQASISGETEYLICLDAGEQSVAACAVTANEGSAQQLNGMTELSFFGARYVQTDGAVSNAAVAETLGVEETQLIFADEWDESGLKLLRIDESADEIPLVFMTKGGKYYHVDASCSGMRNALAVSLGDAKLDGKEPCPVCVGEDSWAGDSEMDESASN